MATPANDALQSQTHLVRTIEAALKVAVPDREELQFRGSLLRCATAEIKTLKPAFIIRMYEAACDVKFPSDEVAAFRKALQAELGRTFDLRQFRNPPAPRA